MRLPTASYLPIAMECAGASVLPRVERDSHHAERGRAIHRYLHAARKAGREVALAQVEDAETRAFCAELDLTALPHSAQPELTFAWNWKTDKARVLGESLGRDYSAATEDEIVGTADLFDDSLTAAIYDFKTGFSFVPADSWQMKGLALFAARSIGASEAEANIVRIVDGKPQTFTAHFDAMDLDEHAVALMSMAKRIQYAEEHLAETGTVDVRAGEHCRYCKCVEACPAHTALARQLPPTLADIETRLDAMTDGQLSETYGTLVLAETVLKRVRDGLETIARTRPIRLGKNKVLKEVEKVRESIDPDIASRVLVEKYGTDGLKAAETKVTKASLKRAGYVDALDAIRDAGGIAEKVTVSVEECKG